MSRSVQLAYAEKLAMWHDERHPEVDTWISDG
jgi:hypothetical protein